MTRRIFCRDCRLPARDRRELCCNGLLRREQWQLLTDVSAQPIRSHLQGSRIEKAFGFLKPKNGTNRLSRNVGKKLSLPAA